VADGDSYGLLARAEDGPLPPARVLQYHPVTTNGATNGAANGPSATLGHMLRGIAVAHGPPAFDDTGTLGIAWQGLGDGQTPDLAFSLRPAGQATFHRLHLDALRPNSIALTGRPGGFGVVIADDFAGLTLVEVEAAR